MPRPIGPLTTPSQELRHFTNREQERDALRRLLDLAAGQPLPVLMFFGVGGTGKSWLLRKLRAELPPELPSALLDFEPLSGGTPYHTDQSRALAELRRQLSAVECPRFDLAYSWLRFHEGVTDEPLLKGKGLAGIAAEAFADVATNAAAGVPLVGAFVKKVAARLGTAFKGSRLERWFAEKMNQEDFLRLRRMLPQEIYPLLTDRLLQDLAEGLPERAGRACRAVFFLDTVEAVRVGQLGDAEAHRREQWLRDLHRTDSPVLLVLAGRDRLSWEAFDPEYNDRRFLEQHLVGGLSERDARTFLGRCGITNPGLQDAVLRVSVDAETAAKEGEVGYRAFSLGLCADTLRNDPQADPASFDMAPGDVARLALRFLKSLSRPAYEIWVRRLALTPRFDEAAARAAFSPTANVYQDAAWQYLIGFSFVQGADELGWWTLHVRMRRALEDVYAEPAASDHRFWQEHWQMRCRSEVDDFAALAWYHQYALQPEAAHTAWKALAEKCRKARRMADHYRLLGWWDATGLEGRLPGSPEAANRLVELGTALWEATLGIRQQNLLRAIACHEAALRVYTEADFPQDWAMTQNNLGVAYAELPAGDRAENLGRAIACYEAALRVRTEADFPQQWAATQNNLGNAYAQLPAGDRAENLGRAIACYEAALRVRTEADFPQDWAMTQNNLGVAYDELPAGDRAENVRKAIACYEAALRVRTEADFPQDWAATQNNLGNAYAQLPAGDRAENLGRAIACYEAALRVRTEADFPQDWAMTQNNLGVAYAELPAGDRAENLGRAIACYEAALRVRTEADFPQQWAMTQNNLGIAHGDLPAGDRAENLGRAIACYEAALRVYTEADFPQDWAMTQENLGQALHELATLTTDKALVESATACFEAARRGYNSCGLVVEAEHMHRRAEQTAKVL